MRGGGSLTCHVGVGACVELALQQGQLAVSRLRCNKAANVLQCLRGKSAEEVQAVIMALPEVSVNGSRIGSAPVADGVVMPRSFAQAVAKGQLLRIPLITGFCVNDTALLAASAAPVTYQAFESFVEGKVGSTWTPRFMAVYQPSSTDIEYNLRLLGTFVTDMTETCSNRRMAALMANASIPVYLFSFNRTPPCSSWGVEWGAEHESELQVRAALTQSHSESLAHSLTYSLVAVSIPGRAGHIGSKAQLPVERTRPGIVADHDSVLEQHGSVR